MRFCGRQGCSGGGMKKAYRQPSPGVCVQACVRDMACMGYRNRQFHTTKRAVPRCGAARFPIHWATAGYGASRDLRNCFTNAEARLAANSCQAGFRVAVQWVSPAPPSCGLQVPFASSSRQRRASAPRHLCRTLSPRRGWLRGHRLVPASGTRS